MVHLFYRKKREGANSIEMVFANLDAYLLLHQNFVLPYNRISLKSLCYNIMYAFRHRGKVNHITGDVQYIALGLGKHTLLTIHDVGSALHGNFLKRFIVKWLWFKLPSHMVGAISVISEFTKNELAAIIPESAHKIHVIYNAFNSQITYHKKAFSLDCPVILHIGTKNNKNLERVIVALKNIRCRLVIVGKLSLAQKKLLDNNFINYNNFYDVSYEEILRFYSECDIVSFPSFYEGFGVPVLEANAAGRPILCGDIPVLHEVAANAALYVNPFDVNAISEGFTQLISDESLRNILRENGFKNLERFSPKLIANQYNELYKILQ